MASTPLTEAELIDVRRYCGYPTHSYFGETMEADYGLLELRLANMTDAELSVIRVQYLATLPGLEAAIVGAGSNLDTDQAAVWHHNRDEVAHRSDLFNRKRRDLCGYIGVTPGGALGVAGRLVRA